jgi:hypothetical protein
MIAYKGETVTCENGHAICDVAQNIGRFSGCGLELFTAWRGDGNPAWDPRGQRCPDCGGEYIRPMSLDPPPAREGWRRAMPWLSDEERAYQARGLQLHVGTGWRR